MLKSDDHSNGSEKRPCFRKPVRWDRIPFLPRFILCTFLHEKHKMKGSVLYCLCPLVSSRKMIIWFRLNLVIRRKIYNNTFVLCNFINFGLNIDPTLHESAALLQCVGCLSLMIAVCYQAEVSAFEWSLVQRSPTECRFIWVWLWSPDNDRPWPIRGCCAIKTKILCLSCSWC